MNVTYAMLAENRTEKELRQFDAELDAPPGKRPSTGVSDLMRVMAGQGRGQRGGRR